MRCKRHLTRIFMLIMVLWMWPSTSYAQQDIQKEAAKDSQQDPEYIKGRPLTEEEIEEQKSHVPELQDLTVPVEDVASEAENSVLRNKEPAAMASSHYDSRKLGLVTSVKEQGDWGTCWAFSTVSALETAAIKAGLANNDVDYSEQHLAYFFYHRVADPLQNTKGDMNKAKDTSSDTAYLNVGGNSAMTANALSGWMGPALEETVPYSAHSAPAIPDDGVAYTNAAIVKNSYMVPNNNATIKNAITNYGSVSVMYGHDDSFYNYDTAAFYSPKADVNHLVTIIGWDDNYSKYNFKSSNRPNSNGAWIVKNSWSEKWGDNGIFYLSYKNKSMVNMLAYEVESAENFDHNYYYDGTAGMESDYIKNNGSISNIYQANGNSSGYDEMLNRVQFTLYSTDVSYSIQVYKGLTNRSDPTSGTKALSTPVQGTTGEAGTYNVDLNQTVTLPHGTLYSIVITLSNPENSVYYAVEQDADYSWVAFEAQITPGQSFVKTTSSSSWVDLANTGEAGGKCARIKAYTNDANTATGTANLSDTDISSVSDQLYTGSAIEPDITVQNSGQTLTEGTDYDLSYSNNTDVGQASITIIGKGNYAGELIRTFNIIPTKTTITKADSVGYDSIELAWDEVSGITGYEILRATNNTEDFTPIATITDSSTLFYIDTELELGNTYYYKVQTYKTVDGTPIYGECSQVESASDLGEWQM